jgi:vacuolar-type H+-ATPase subunit I/STV1
VSPEALKNMIKNGMDAMVGAVEKIMYGISDGLAKERKEKEQNEEDRKWRAMRENDMTEEKRRKEEERVRRLEEKLEKLVRELKINGRRERKGRESWRRRWRERW